jgi:hypothetical protein
MTRKVHTIEADIGTHLEQKGEVDVRRAKWFSEFVQH